MSKLETSYEALWLERNQLLKDVAFYKGAMEVVQAENRRYRETEAMASNIFNRMEAQGGHGITNHRLIREWRAALVPNE